MAPVFSILHTSARPDTCLSVYRDWASKAIDGADSYEYILCMDSRWGFTSEHERLAKAAGVDVVVWNEGRRCYVDGVNTAARASSGSILIVNADDQFACDGWDKKLFDVLLSAEKVATAFVIEVSTGTPDEHNRGILVMPILSRRRYQDQGDVVFFAAYESMFADNDFCEWARRDGVVIDARHLMFEHRHWLNGRREKDSVDAVQNRTDAWILGHTLIADRRVNGFGAASILTKESAAGVTSGAAPARMIALCLMGERFEGAWVDSLLTVYSHLISKGFNVVRLRNEYSTNVYVAREEIRAAIVEVRPDLVFWLDDDNICTPAHFDMLLADLDGRPDLDGVTGWCWIHDREKTSFRVSCGTFAPTFSHWQPFPNSFAFERELRPVEASGFPCFLMRLSAIEKAGERPFIRNILDPLLPHGMLGEDMAFMRAALQGGAVFAADPRVRVPHLKFVEVEPILESEGRPSQNIAVILRVKNEGRWIGRVIDAAKMLGPVFVMDDGSTDDTAAIAQQSGAWVRKSPFIGETLDESRDKNWLVQWARDVVKAAALDSGRFKLAGSIDWFLCIDGDEELQPGGADMIRRACESGAADMFKLRVLFLWDKPNQARIDRWYANCSRMSLFRNLPEWTFRSYYDGCGTHSGLHTGNAPSAGPGSVTAAALNVWLLHYGYMVKEDRIRKYEYYNRIDPNNEIEDCYRHIAQGDLEEIPADLVLKHAGPVELRRLPPSLAPDFDMASLEGVEVVR
jgi:hypothetical protein